LTHGIDNPMSRLRATTWIAPLLTVFLALACGPPRGTRGSGTDREVDLADAARPPRVSRSLLESCWTKDELRGSPADRIAVRGGSPVVFPPEREAPRHVLPPVPADRVGSIRSAHPSGGRKLVALTFDVCEPAGETTGYDDRVVDYLRANGVKATFFLGGKWMATHEERAMQLIADPLFEIGNHSWSHRDERRLTPDQLRREVLWAQAEYELVRERLLARPCAAHAAETGAVPPLPRLYRFPYGTCTTADLGALAALGVAAVQWDVVTGDPAPGQTARMIAQVVLRGVRPGSIVVGHANGLGRHTAEALPLYVPTLRERGYEFVTVSELLAAGPAVVREECYKDRPGDQSYARRRIKPKAVAPPVAAPADVGPAPVTTPPATESEVATAQTGAGAHETATPEATP
jgi:peptidoglycan/xylan/chitin deacetylase (PgdA/CDA1 family)